MATLDAPSTDKDQKIVLGGSSEFLIRRVARLAKTVREYAGKLVQVRLAILFERGGLTPVRKVGITTNSIDASIHEFILSHSAYPSPLLYSNYPRSCCTRYVAAGSSLGTLVLIIAGSVNNIIAHGIPDE
jgi:methionyl aminopeptidase